MNALIFGYNDYALEIAKNIGYKDSDIVIFDMNFDTDIVDKAEYKIRKFDLSDEWDDLKNEFDMKNSIVFCVLEDNAQNVFLTISLRSIFKDLTIIALSKNRESANKLSMAGANKVIPMVQTTASIITDMLKKPIVTEVLHSILYEQSELKVAQIEVEKDDYFDGKYPADIEWHRVHGIIVLSVIREDMSGEFIYSSKALHKKITNGDIFVVVGYENDIKEFEKLVGRRCNVNWSNRSR